MTIDRRLFLVGACCAGAGLAAGLATGLNQTRAAAPAPGADVPAFARQRFLSHWNCTQAVLESLASQTGLTPEDITRISTPFAAGLWNGMVCGSFTGAAMAIGMRFGRISDGDGKAADVTKAKMREFMQAMTARYGDLNCSAILGVDMATDAGIKEAADKGLYGTKCASIVEAAASEALKLMA